jgi:hypothetical protein
MPCLALPRTWSRAGRQGRRRPHPAAASTFDCRHRCAGRHRDGWGEQHGWPSWRLYLPDPPKSSCLALAPLVAATGVALGRSPGSASSTTTPTSSGCATPTRSRRLTGSRACVEDHRRPVTGGTYGSRCRRLGSPQSSREVPAETQEGPAGTGRDGVTAEGSGFGGSGDLGGGRREPGGPVWPLEVPVRDAVAHRLRPVGISDPGPLCHGRSGPGLPRSTGGGSSPAAGVRYCRTWERPGGSTPSRRTRRAG